MTTITNHQGNANLNHNEILHMCQKATIKKTRNMDFPSGPVVRNPPENCEGSLSLACCSPWGHKESDMTYY